MTSTRSRRHWPAVCRRTRLLSHDLFEGIFARAGLASDIELVDEYPARYAAATARSHRWVRGDWQLLSWVFGCGPAGVERRRRSDPAARSMEDVRQPAPVPHGAGQRAHPRDRVDAAAAVRRALDGIRRRDARDSEPAARCWPAWCRVTRGIALRSHVRAVAADARLAAARTALTLALLAHQAWSMCDAIGRTLYRLFVSRRNLLEWVTAQEQNSERLDVAGHYRLMAGALVIGLAVLGLVATGQASVLLAVPFTLLWLSSPLLACWVSQPSRVAESQPVSDVDAHALRLVARRAWHYFDTFVTPADNMLPPDNFQEEPRPVLAHRTSPTNLGLYLLSIVTARDLGWAGTVDTVERLESTLATMSRLEQCHGHFFNWYDTQDLRPLEPRYVSSVDSGNLAAHLLTLANACDGMRARHRGRRAGPGRDRRRAGAGPRCRSVRRPMRGSTRRSRHCAPSLSGRTPSPAPLAAHLDALAVRVGAVVALIVAVGQRGWRRRQCRDGRVGRGHAPHDRESSARPGAGATERASVPCRHRLDALAATARRMAAAMRFDFLFDHERKLLSIGYRVLEGSLDPSCYDLLASEARLASFVAIANGDVPARHWFRLGRAVVRVRSWRCARLVVRLDVRIPDAVARHARARRQPARADQSPRGRSSAGVRQETRRARGESRSRPTTRVTSSAPTSTRVSACLGSA